MAVATVPDRSAGRNRTRRARVPQQHGGDRLGQAGARAL